MCPVAIKYNKIFVDAFWNSKRQSFSAHLVKLMRSWALVCDVYFLEPQARLMGACSGLLWLAGESLNTCLSALKHGPDPQNPARPAPPPQNRRPDETAQQFAERVQRMIAGALGQGRATPPSAPLPACAPAQPILASWPRCPPWPCRRQGAAAGGPLGRLPQILQPGGEGTGVGGQAVAGSGCVGKWCLWRREWRQPATATLPPSPYPAPVQHPDLIEKQRRVFSDAIRAYADPQPAAGAGAGGRPTRSTA